LKQYDLLRLFLQEYKYYLNFTMIDKIGIAASTQAFYKVLVKVTTMVNANLFY